LIEIVERAMQDSLAERLFFREMRVGTGRQKSSTTTREREANSMAVPAPWRDTPGPTWPPLAAMFRNQCRQFSESPGQVQPRLTLS
jgi:hypothetical protein